MSELSEVDNEEQISTTDTEQKPILGEIPSTSKSAIETKNGTKRKKQYAQHRQDHELNDYNKKKILNHMKENGCTTQSIQNCLKRMTVSHEIVHEYFNESIKKAQEHVHEECGSICFDNIDEWIKFFKDTNLNKCSYNEAALVTLAIAGYEKHPDPSDLDKIDLKAIYNYLGQSMLGMPPGELNEESANFLKAEFAALIDEANTDVGDNDALRMRKHLKNLTERNVLSEEKLSLDPLEIEENIK